jgi:Ca2+ transporting ATPase
LANKHTVPSPILLSGTKILTGEGRMIVLVVGESSCIGKIRALLEKDDPEPTPLQQKLEELATDIGKFGLYSALLIIIVMLIRFAIIKGTTKEWHTGPDLIEILNFFIIGIIVVVVAIPEGLPLSVTISLAFSVKKMLNDQNLVRRMEACETMGGANNICSDKTGTLTMNKMTLAQIWNRESKQVDLYKETLDESELSSNKQFNELFKIASLVNSTAQLDPEEKGSSTEIAILKYFKRMGTNYEEYKNKFDIKFKIPFSSARKRMSIVLEYQNSASLFIKGASEIVLESCPSWFNTASGEV